MAQNILCLGKCLKYARKECVFCCCLSVVFYKHQLGQVCLIVLFKSSTFLVFFCLLVLSVIKREILKSLTKIEEICVFLLTIPSDLFHVF